MMELYPKIDSIFKRDDKGRFTDEYSCDAFKYLANNEWTFTEKIDGTNIRIGFDALGVHIGGRTERAQIPAHLVEYLSSTFTEDKFTDEIVLYGEGYGHKIQKGGRYLEDRVGFILFDVRVGNWWLKRDDILDIGSNFGVPVVPVIGCGTLEDACKMAKDGIMSQVGDCDAEGIVLRPAVELKERSGRRIITKVKTRDFK